MNIIYDHQTFSIQNFGGISRYVSELIKGINNSKFHQAYLPILFSNNIYLTQTNLNVNLFLRNYNFPKKQALIYWLNQEYSKQKMVKKDYNIFHATYYDPYFIPYLKGKPYVITFHDMIHEKFSEQYKEFGNDKKLTNQKKLLAEKATRIIAVSESAKKDIVDILGVDSEKIQVIYHGNSLIPKSIMKVELSSPYFLYVGNRQRYKNFEGLLYSIAPLLKKNKLLLICAGGGRFTTDEQIFIDSLQVRPFIKQRPVDDNSLCHLYKSAIAFIFPSKYEGFGIPILEAFACECPCILSNAGSLPEIAGEAALYFDPYNDDSIRCSVEQIIDNEPLRDKLIRSGSNRLKLFSWEHTVHETLSLYETCM